ncbi:M1 family metallopeptidase [Microlunatus speluncae]|uniref:M1 family metallopeptidase n=1 Tax=Microlunatus speluncae TaxID=2594267 RepID=UPI001375FDF3|nr:M1 family metallopeptidase [Microlunatus speluncae]
MRRRGMVRAIGRSAAAAAVIGALVAGPASGAFANDGDDPTPGAPGVGDAVYPNLGNGGYQVTRYDLDLDATAADKTVAGRVRIHAVASQSLSRFNLDSAGLEIGSVEVDGRKASAKQDGEELVITPARAIRKGRTFVITVAYAADPAKIPPPAGGWVITDDGFATAPQPSGAHTIFPSNDHPSDKAHYLIRITAPKGTIGVASGKHLTDRTNDDGSTTSTYLTRHPMATELLQAAVGDFTVVKRGRVDDAELRDVVPTGRLADSEAALKLTPGQLDWARERLGEFPLEAYGIMPANTDKPDAFDFTGLETQTLTLYKPNYLKQPEDKIGSHMMHELVHNWFGNSVTPASWSDLWLNEGHADYYGLLYRYERGWPDSSGFTSMEQRMKYTYGKGDQWRASSGPVAKPNADNLFDNQRYTGGVLVLFALWEKVGQEKFAEIERAALRRHSDRTLSTEQYIDLAARVSDDESVRPFLEDWLYGTKTPPMPNHPDWTVEPPGVSTLDTPDLQSDRKGH